MYQAYLERIRLFPVGAEVGHDDTLYDAGIEHAPVLGVCTSHGRLVAWLHVVTKDAAHHFVGQVID